MATLTASRLTEVLSYDPQTGVFSWQNPTTNRVKTGDRAGHPDTQHGYRLIGIDGRVYHAGRLAFLYMTGTMPAFVDHINRDRADDRWDNLRSVTRSQNQMNRTKQSNNTSGFKGVHFISATGRWRARIGANTQQQSLGVYDTPELAHRAYLIAAAKLHGEFANK